MSKHIGITMGGYVDENMKLMDRTELNRRITELQEEHAVFKDVLGSALDSGLLDNFLSRWPKIIKKIKG